MDILFQTDEIAIYRMQDNLHDYQLMAKWLTDEKVLEFYEGKYQDSWLMAIDSKKSVH